MQAVLAIVFVIQAKIYDKTSHNFHGSHYEINEVIADKHFITHFVKLIIF